MISPFCRAAARKVFFRAAALVLSALLLTPSCLAEAVVCDTLSEAREAGRRAERALAEGVRLSLPEEVLLAPHRIHDDKGIPGEWDLDDAVWNMLYLFPSVYRMSYAVRQRDRRVLADLYFFYRDGVRIMRCVRTGTEEALTAEEQAALRAARGIAASVSPSLPPRERLLELCGALCGVLTFLDPRGAGDIGDVNSCITALSSGRANCQGYSDAFYLCASLAGFEAGFRNGWNRAGESHTWNRVLADGVWLDVDLTWMDSGDGEGEKYFLMDEDVLLEGHLPEESAWPGVAGD